MIALGFCCASASASTALNSLEKLLTAARRRLRAHDENPHEDPGERGRVVASFSIWTSLLASPSMPLGPLLGPTPAMVATATTLSAVTAPARERVRPAPEYPTTP